MKSLAIVRAADFLKLNSMLLEMNRAGLNFEGKPKEINPASIEKLLSLEPSGENGVCALVCLSQDYELSRSRLQSRHLIPDMLILDVSHKFFEYFVKLIPLLPDLAMSHAYKQDSKPPRVYLGVFVNRKVQVQTVSGSIHAGILKHADSFGILFEPSDSSDSLFITWHDVKKIIIPKEEKN